MCGIVGYIDNCVSNKAVKTVLDGLKTLEYRGYDSAGVAYIEDKKITAVKQVGYVDVLKSKVETMEKYPVSSIAIGHTRWATHGGVTKINAHPHLSNCGTIAIVHNGIISNYKKLKANLKKTGTKFVSQTDTEVIPNVIAKYKNNGNSLLAAVQLASKELDGSYAFIAIDVSEPEVAIAARKDRQPLIIACGDNFTIVSSDISLAKSKNVSHMYALEDGEFALIRSGEQPIFFDVNKSISKQILPKQKPVKLPSKKPYKTFMEKEIRQIPQVIRRIDSYYAKKMTEPNFARIVEKLKNAKTIHIAACGTSYHAGLYIASELERVKKRTRVYIASETNYQKPFLEADDIGIVISQSGETADTISALKYFKEKEIFVLGLCNIEGSSISRYVDFCLPTLAGVEVAVASTKAYIAQVLVGVVLVAAIKGQKICFADVARRAEAIIKLAPMVKQQAQLYKSKQKIFFLGKGNGSTTSLECALKVKEITYRHCEGFAAGELKHGTLSLIDEDTLVVAFGTSCNNAVAEVKARDASVWHITNKTVKQVIPTENKTLVPLTDVIFAQLYALYLATAIGNNPDKPRNLAKSVTVD